MEGLAAFTIIMIMVGVGLFFLLLPLLAIVDIVRSNFQDNSEKLIWVIIVLFFPIFGSIIYFAMSGKNKI